jgi:tight adherence protein B
VIRRTVAAFALLAALTVAATASAAGNSLQIKGVDTSGYPTVKVTVKSSTPSDKAAISLTENGKPASAMSVSDPNTPPAIALLIDTSKTMTGQKLKDAIAAASEFVRQQAVDTTIGVYGFGDTAYTASPLGTDESQTVTAVSQLAISQNAGTALYGALSLAAKDLSTTPAEKRVVVLLTDGASKNDTATLEDALAAASDAKVQVYPIGVETYASASDALQRMAKETGGRFSNVSSSSALSGVYDALSRELGSTYVVTYESHVPQGAPIELGVSAPGYTEATQSLKAPGKFVPEATGSGSSWLPQGETGRMVVAGVAALFVLLATILLLSAKPSVILRKRIAPFTEQRSAAATLAENDPDQAHVSILHQLYIATEKIVGSMNWWKRMSRVLEQADLPLRTAELYYIQLGTGLVLGAFTAFVLGHRGLIALAALVIGIAIPAMFVKFKAKQRMSAFENQLPETLITMAAGLKAGHAFNQAMQSAVNEGAEPTSKEFQRVLTEVQLGMPAEQAMDAMAKRMNSTNFGFVVMAVNIQRTVGGSLADILDMVADTVRQRQQFTKKVKALTAQGRASAYVLIAMPFLMGLAIYLVNGTYMKILWTDSLGKILIAGSLVSMAIGSVIIKKIVSFKG